MPWPRTVLGAWYVLRGNQVWAPYPDNDPDGARTAMRRFYRLLTRDQGLPIDVRRAAELEVRWWHEHRVLQRERAADDDSALLTALCDLNAYIYGLPAERFQASARARAWAMRLSDAWVADGCDPGDARLPRERLLLVACYTRLLDVVGPGAQVQ
jgi:hypothetical protein